MLDNITLENFKGFQKLNNLKIKPITILCGTNSCGKTSILQSILLLKQTLESKNPNQTLLLNGRFVKLGYFQDLIFQKKENSSVKLSINIKDKGNSKFQNFSNFIQPTENAHRKQFLFNTYIQVDIDFQYINDTLLIDKLHFQSTLENSDSSFSNLSINIAKNNSDYFIKWNNIKIEEKWTGETNAALNFSNIFNVSLDLDNIKDFTEKYKRQVELSNLVGIFSLINDCLKDEYAKITYLGPLRGEPEREYIYRNEIMEVGNKGENAAFIFLSQQEKPIKDHFFYNKNTDNFEKIQETDLKHAVNKWLNQMNIKDFEAKILNKIIYLNLAASSYDSTEVGIADVGFGVSQIFPIVLEGLRMDKGNTLLLEQPEIHLHPNLQMQLSDYFISLALSGKNIIAETHSDHIINRLVRRIVEDEKHNLSDLIGIYFIKPSENGSVFEEINIDESKGITNWPIDFFDQTANEQMRIMQAGIKKRKNAKTSKNQ